MSEEKWLTLVGMFYNLDNQQIQKDHPLSEFKEIDLYDRVLVMKRLSEKKADEILEDSLQFGIN